MDILNTIVSFFFVICHLAVMQEAYYLKPLSWFLVIWVIDIMLAVLNFFTLMLFIKNKFYVRTK